MALPKKPKPVLKLMEKTTKTIKKKKKRSTTNFTSYLYKVLKSVDNVGITRKSMLIMNSFVNDILEKIAEEAACLVSHTKGQTLTSRDIQLAISLVVPGELGKVANMQAAKAVAMYERSRNASQSTRTLNPCD